MSGPTSPPEIGNCMPLANIPAGLEIHNIEMNPGQGGKLVRSAGGVARLGAKEGEWSVIILPSRRNAPGAQRLPGDDRPARQPGLDQREHRQGRAQRHMGIRPHTRAKAMNPIDHPMGGGEGRANGGRHPCSETGVLAKGGNTRSPRKNSEKLILRRRKFGTHPAAAADGERVTDAVARRSCSRAVTATLRQLSHEQKRKKRPVRGREAVPEGRRS